MKSFNTRRFFVAVLSVSLMMLLLVSSMVLATSEATPTYYFLGSSVTFGARTEGVAFPEILAKDNGWICVKEAVSGTTLVDNGETSYIQRMINNIDPSVQMDHLIVQLSTNDALIANNFPLGAVSSSKNLADFDTSTIIGAIEYIIAYADQTWHCPVTFFANPKYNNKPYANMIAALYEVQAKWQIGIIDFFYYKNMAPLDDITLKTYMGDSVHPVAEGYQWMASVMGDYLIAYDVVAAINTLPETITLENEAAIRAANADYAALTDSQKLNVNADQIAKLTAAEATIVKLNDKTGTYLLFGGLALVILAAIAAGLIVAKKRQMKK